MAANNPAWALVAEFSDEPQATIAQGMLENHGIATWLETNRMSTLYAAGSTWAPVKLYVEASQLAEARELLSTHGDVS